VEAGIELLAVEKQEVRAQREVEGAIRERQRRQAGVEIAAFGTALFVVVEKRRRAGRTRPRSRRVAWPLH